ncbi:AAA domain containing protein [uncultured Caudovirales phage]|uniref:AAA domain containing protein n=1 Tax=uncultured Caudovirales phage TaxID=2100421 RepID=A0A6J5N212_9CAUD|nr:AAA domain containing protein [uncultured Caudovirales phage]
MRIGVFGPSGSGKSMSSLRLAYGLTQDWNKIVVIDTENKSADLYSHLGSYSVITLEAPFNPEKYIEAITVAENAGMEVIIIDSITHEWAGQGGILELADTLGKDAKSSFTVWAKLTPRHNKFIERILQSKAHIICCGRSKQEYAINQTEKNGKTVNVPEKMGLKAVTREGFDYEMTLSFEIAITHLATSTKDRTGLFQDKPEAVITEEYGVRISDWNSSGAEPLPDYTALKRKMVDLLKEVAPGYNPPTDPTASRVYIFNLVKNYTGIDIKSNDDVQRVIDSLTLLASAAATGAMDNTVEMDGMQPEPTDELYTEPVDTVVI